ncbi:MAG: LytTR family transcriptional regulator [Myxococcaceae bacterium]|nr:LytTR family transcriptional regulator [Myxococcaceae bacterium]
MSTRVLLGLAVWTLLTALTALQDYLWFLLEGRPPTWDKALLWGASEWYTWALLLPLVLMLARRFPLEPGPRLWRHLAVHLVLASVFAVLQPALQAFFKLATVGAGALGTSYVVTFHRLFALKLHWEYIIYGLLVAGWHLLQALRRVQAQELARRELEAQAARAEQEVLSLASSLQDMKGGVPGQETPVVSRDGRRFAVRQDGRVVLVRAEDVDWVEADGRYCVLHVGKEHHRIREALAAVEARLGHVGFVRASRSTLVNLERIRELHELFHGAVDVVLHNGDTVRVSRRCKEQLLRNVGAR